MPGLCLCVWAAAAIYWGFCLRTSEISCSTSTAGTNYNHNSIFHQRFRLTTGRVGMLFMTNSNCRKVLLNPGACPKWSAHHQVLLKSDNDPFTWIKCAGAVKHVKHSGQVASRAGINKHCCQTLEHHLWIESDLILTLY